MTLGSLRYILPLAATLLVACGSDNNPSGGSGQDRPPTANAGADQTVREGTTVTLSGDGNDDKGIARFTWTQTGGPAVDYQTSGQRLTFVAPDVRIQTQYEFSLVVTDTDGNASAPDTVTVTVNQVPFFGTAPGGPEDYTHLLDHFDQLTPENAGKWGSVEATRDVMNWTDLDTAYEFAKNNGIAFKFHVLLWGQQQPGWISSLPPEEQLEEIEEWMAEVAARYPDLEYIEVVNEPMNAPPPYRDALGGAGETGFDWIITAFEMAREHFPNAQLLINEFNVIIEDGLTTNYLRIIDLLRERGLIDGIGEQSHFYERANLDVVAANLDRLAATGLPIYISEFDLNLADDADHANVMRDLLTLFWTHPNVAGITHWGHLQGSVWRTNGYLVRNDGSLRPALEWIKCFMEGEDDCEVPEYTSPGWSGDEFGLTLPAVNHDEGRGVVSGGVIAYTDDGDWILFRDVEFRSDWDTLWVSYQKGNTDPGSISIHLDSLDEDPIATVDLPPTGSWGSTSTVEQPWTGFEATHDVYIRFNDGPGVANLESIRIGKPLPDSGVNLIPNGDFEANSVAGWSAWNGSTLMASSDQAHGGTYSLLATARPDANQFAVYNITGLITRDTTYSVSSWVRHEGAANDTVRLAAKVECAAGTEPVGHNTYPWLNNNGAVPPGTWTELAANLVIPDCDIVDIAIFFEGTTAGVDVFIDDVKLVPPGTNLVNNGDFEANSVAGWSSWNGSTLSATSAQARSGSYSMLATGRPNTNQFAVYSLTSVVAPNTTYPVSAWVRHAGAAPDTVRLAAKVECAAGTEPAGHNTYPWLDNNAAVPPDTWTELSANLVIPDCDIVDVAIFFEGTTDGIDVYLDDVVVTGP